MQKKVLLPFALVGLGFVAGMTYPRISKDVKVQYTQKNFDSGCYFSDSGNNEPLFKLDGKVFRLNELSKENQTEFYQAKFNAYKSVAGFVDELAARQALATSSTQGSPATASATDAEIKATYDKWVAAGQIPKGQSLEQASERIANALNESNVRAAIHGEMLRNRAANKVVTLVEPPCAPKMEIPVAGMPVKGNRSSSSQLVYFIDYSCFSCRAEYKELEQTLARHASDLHMVQIPVAADSASLSGKLARVGHCALQQGEDKFWKFHNAVVAKNHVDFHEANKTPQSQEKFVESNAQLAELSADWKECANSSASADAVQKFKPFVKGYSPDSAALFFLNGHMLTLRPSLNFSTGLDEIFGKKTEMAAKPEAAK